MRGPLIFRGPYGASDVEVFRDATHAISYAEAIDVLNGDYGDHGWDAEGRLIKLVAQQPEPPPPRGFIGRLFRVVPPGTVELRPLDAPPQPRALRRVLITYLVELEPSQAASLESMSLEDLLLIVPINA
jgi:hypothetical protein